MPAYTVKSGDTLSAIAQSLGYGGDYSRLAKENSIANPNVIRAGQVINYGGAAPTPAPTSAPISAPSAQPQPYSAPQSYAGGGGTTPEGISISSLPPDLIYNGQLDVSNPVKKAKYDQIVTQNRQNNPSGDSGSFFTQPSIDLVGIYQSLYDKSPIKGTQAEFDTITQEIEKRQFALNDAIAKIGDNPYLSEATMSGRIDKLNKKFNADAQVLVGKQTNLQNKIAQSKADVETQLNLQTKQFDIQSQQAQQALAQFNNMLQLGALDGASGADIANITRATGLSSNSIQAAISANKKKNIQTQTISYDDGTNSGFVTINTQTGDIINKQAIGASAATKSTGGGGGGGASTTASSKADQAKQAQFEGAIATGIKQLEGGSQWGEVWNRIHVLFPDAPPELIDSLLGPSWRKPGAYQAYLANKKGL